MQKNQEVAIPVIRRLPRYYRFISSLISDGIERISSRELSLRMGLTASQIRQDLNCFGGFGQQGYGYNLVVLKEEIGKILGLDDGINTILVGAGNIGKALGRRMNFKEEGFNLCAIFDNSKDVIGKKILDIEVSDIKNMQEFCENNNIKAAIVCVSDSAAKEVIDSLIKLDIKIFWNFTHFDIQLNNPELNLAVENVHLNDSLMTLRYMANNL